MSCPAESGGDVSEAMRNAARSGTYGAEESGEAGDGDGIGHGLRTRDRGGCSGLNRGAET